MIKLRILFSKPTKHHVEIATDELDGLAALGHQCDYFLYAAKDGYDSAFGRLWIILQNAVDLVRTCYDFRPDVVYINSRVEKLAGIRDAITIIILRIAYFKKVKVVIKSHGSDMTVFESKSLFMRKFLLPVLKRNVAAWLFLSSEEKAFVLNRGYLEKDKVFVTKNIVRTDHFYRDKDFRNQYNIPANHNILLFVGRIIREKGIYEVVEAFLKIAEYCKVFLIVVGDGADLSAIKELTEKSKYAHRVIYTGFIPEPEVVNYYSNSNILVFPTYFPEGFPMALFNSVGAGLSILTTPTRAATDYLSEPDNCLWVNAKDSDDVADKLKKLIDEPLLREQMSRNNLLKAAIFSREQVAKEIEEILLKISVG